MSTFITKPQFPIDGTTVESLPQGYKETALDIIIPVEWDIRELRNLIRSHNSGIYKRQTLYGHGCNIVGVADIYDIEKVDGQSFAQVPLSAEEHAKHTLRKDDLLYAESSLVREGIARTVYVTEQGAGTAFAWHTRRYSVKQEKVLSSYLYYYLQSQPARKHMMRQSIQTAITGINTVAYFDCPIILPPLSEQRIIAEAFSDVDGLLGALEKLIAKKRAIKQATMQQLLTGKIRLPGFSGEWGHSPLKRFVRDFIVPMRDKPKRLAGDIPWCRIEDFDGVYLTGSKSEQHVDIHTVQNMNLKVYPVDTLLVSCSANLGRCAIVERPLVSNQTFIGLVMSETAASNLFFYYYMTFNSEELNNLSAGTTISYLSREQFEEFIVCVPTAKEEQQAIAAVLYEMDAEIEALERRRDKTCAIKQGMMQQLLSGKVRLVNTKCAAYA